MEIKDGFLKIGKGESAIVTLQGGSHERQSEWEGKVRLYYDFPVMYGKELIKWSTGSTNARDELSKHTIGEQVRIEFASIGDGKFMWQFHTHVETYMPPEEAPPDTPQQASTPADTSGFEALNSRFDSLGEYLKKEFGTLRGQLKAANESLDELKRFVIIE
jgi:hypothetical protein